MHEPVILKPLALADSESIVQSGIMIRGTLFALLTLSSIVLCAAVDTRSDSAEKLSTTSGDILDMSGFSWAENLCFDSSGKNMFVSDAVGDTIWRIFESGGVYKRVAHLTGFSALGLARTEVGGNEVMVAAVKFSMFNRTLVYFDPTRPDFYQLVLPGSKTGYNGLGVYQKTGKIYSASEGLFIPSLGNVWEIDPETRKATAIISSLNGADGIYIDQERGLLYASEVLTHKMVVYDLESRKVIRHFQVSGIKSIDDFTLSTDGQTSTLNVFCMCVVPPFLCCCCVSFSSFVSCLPSVYLSTYFIWRRILYMVYVVRVIYTNCFVFFSLLKYNLCSFRRRLSRQKSVCSPFKRTTNTGQDHHFHQLRCHVCPTRRGRIVQNLFSVRH